ncbi:exodeoxyribonuclease VII large subunit [Thermoproteota archaeon]
MHSQQPHYLTVSQLNTYLKIRLESDSDMNDVWVAGEISNLKYYHQGGQIYFNLLDKKAQINCVLYANFLENLSFKPDNGLHIVARGKIKFFHKKGTVVFQVSYMILQGEGQLAQQLEQLKNKLTKEGLFDEARKVQLPKYPKKIGLITAFDSAAMWDFISLSRHMMPNVKLVVIPAVMQGIQCPASVIQALDTVRVWEKQQKTKLDIVVIMRGGGSAEDLAGFNNEALIRAVSMFHRPVVTAIGHEVDYTLADFASDFRSPTPTAAVHQLAAHYVLLAESLPVMIETLHKGILSHVDDAYTRITNSLEIIGDEIQLKCGSLNQNLQALLHRVEQTNPLRKFQQGYSITRDVQTQKIIRLKAQVNEGDIIETQVQDGRFQSKVLQVSKLLHEASVIHDSDAV